MRSYKMNNDNSMTFHLKYMYIFTSVFTRARNIDTSATKCTRIGIGSECSNNWRPNNLFLLSSNGEKNCIIWHNAYILSFKPLTLQTQYKETFIVAHPYSRTQNFDSINFLTQQRICGISPENKWNLIYRFVTLCAWHTRTSHTHTHTSYEHTNFSGGCRDSPSTPVAQHTRINFVHQTAFII